MSESLLHMEMPVVSFLNPGFLAYELDMPVCAPSHVEALGMSGTPKDIECPPSGRILKVHYTNGDYLRSVHFGGSQRI